MFESVEPSFAAKYNASLKFVVEIISNRLKHQYQPKHNLKCSIEKIKNWYEYILCDHFINIFTFILLSDSNENGEHSCFMVVKWVFDIDFKNIRNFNKKIDFIYSDERNIEGVNGFGSVVC